MIRYLNPGESVGADKWDAFYAEADAKLGKLLNHVALASSTSDMGGSYLYSRIFYFIPRPASLTEWSNFSEYFFVARRFLRSGVDIFARLYDHQIFTDMVNGLPLATPVSPDTRPPKDDQWKVARLDPGDFAAFDNFWGPKIYPDQPNPFGIGVDALELSLECHTRAFPDAAGLTQKYNVFIDGSSHGPEYIHQWTPVDIVIGAVGPNFFFSPPNGQYDKYNIFRFHNLQAEQVIVRFGVQSAGAFLQFHAVTIPALQSRCVRRAKFEGPYTDGYQYFQKPLAGDPWFLDWRSARNVGQSSVLPEPGQWSNITDVMCGSFLATQAVRGTAVIIGNKMDLSKAWDPSAIYNNAGRTGLKQESEMPVGGWFGAVSEGTLIGDLAFHRGKLVVVDPAGDFLVWRTQPLTVDAVNEQHQLKKEDGSTALGVTSVSVTRVSDGVNIPELSGGDRNWLVDSVKDGGGNPLYFYIVFVVRLAGNDPKLAAGDKVQVRFRHKTDDHRHILEFEGMATLASKLADVGITVDLTPSFPGAKDFILTSDPPRDLISVSSNLILGAFGKPGITIGNGNNGSDAVIFPDLQYSNLNPLVLPFQTAADEHTAQYWQWDWDGSTYINIARVETEPWTNHARTTAFFANVRAGFFETMGSLLTQFRAVAGDATTLVKSVMTAFGPQIVARQSLSTAYPVGVDLAATGFDLDLTSGPALVRNQSIALADVNSVNPSFGWPRYDGSLGIEAGAMKTCFPRFARYWAQKRFFTHKVAEEPFVPMGVTNDTISSEDPLVKAFYEKNDGLKVPFAEGRLLPVAQAGSNAADGIALLGGFGAGEFDFWPRFAAWLKYGVVTFKSPGGDVVYDFTKGSPYQTAYYGIERNNILNGSAGAGDGIGPGGVVMVKKELPISIEHYNAAASAVNACVGALGGYVQADAANFLMGLGRPGSNGGQTGFGLGSYYEIGGSQIPRPREQWVGWDVEINPGIEEFLQRVGCPVQTASTFPASMAEFLNRNYLFAVWDGAGNFHTEEVVFEVDPMGAPLPLKYSPWGPYLFGIASGPNTPDNPNADLLKKALDNYRWVSITDAVTLHQRLGLPFVFQELCVPMLLRIRDAGWAQHDTRSGSGSGLTVQTSRACNWVNAAGGDWVVNNDAGDPARIMAVGGHEQTDYCSVEVATSAGTVTLYDAAYPDGLQRRFYGRGEPVSPTQADVANEFYLYRNYGGGKVSAVIFPRNYAGYRKNFNGTFVNFEAPGGPFENRPRNVNNGLEGGAADVKTLGAGDNVISTTVENGELYIVAGYRDV